MLRIPFADYPAFNELVSLDGAFYWLQFQWNERGQYWTMSIKDQDKQPIVSGIKLVLDYELISAYRWMGVPPGELRAVNSSGTLLRPGLEDFISGAAQLIYTPEAEIGAAL